MVLTKQENVGGMQRGKYLIWGAKAVLLLCMERKAYIRKGSTVITFKDLCRQTTFGYECGNIIVASFVANFFCSIGPRTMTFIAHKKVEVLYLHSAIFVQRNEIKTTLVPAT